MKHLRYHVAKRRVKPLILVSALKPGTYVPMHWTDDRSKARTFTFNVAQAVAGRSRGALVVAHNTNDRHA